MLFEQYSHDKRYKFEIQEASQNRFLVKLFSFDPEWKGYDSVQGMEQICGDMEQATKLGTALLALLEQG